MPGPLTAEQVARTLEGTDEAVEFNFTEHPWTDNGAYIGADDGTDV